MSIRRAHLVRVTDVGVTVLNGDVRPGGRVSSDRECQRAGQIARSVNNQIVAF
jgi:osmotically-inducible protein OsmY